MGQLLHDSSHDEDCFDGCFSRVRLVDQDHERTPSNLRWTYAYAPIGAPSWYHVAVVEPTFWICQKHA